MDEKEILKELLKLKGKYLEEQLKLEKRINAINATIEAIEEESDGEYDEEIKNIKKVIKSNKVEEQPKKEEEIFFFEENDDEVDEFDEALKKDKEEMQKKKSKIKETIEKIKK